ncbi:hypothetical protein VCHC37A1_0367B, partial [Vibrio cholerae HC-37A1]
IDHE